MKPIIAILAVALAAFGAAPDPETEEPISYDVVAVKRHLLLTVDGDEVELKAGDRARSGDSLRTGSRSSADLEVRERAARFHIGSKTRFQLAHDRPGVLIDIERGSLRGVFDKLPEGDSSERIVITPSAVLAVRGTEYGVEVAKDGDTTVVVFEGTVDIRDRAGLGETIQVGAGQSTRIRKGQTPGAPKANALSPADWDRGRRSQSAAWDTQRQNPSENDGSRQTPETTPARSAQSGSSRHGG